MRRFFSVACEHQYVCVELERCLNIFVVYILLRYSSLRLKILPTALFGDEADYLPERSCRSPRPYRLGLGLIPFIAQRPLCNGPLADLEAQRVTALTLFSGLQPGIQIPRCCARCRRHYSSMWALAADSTLRLVGSPEGLQCFQIRSRVDAAAVSFVDVAVLEFCTSSVCNLAASFVGVLDVLGDICCDGGWTAPSRSVRQDFFSAWLAWRALQVLHGRGSLEEVRGVPFYFGHNARSREQEWMSQVAIVLERSHLEMYARQHRGRHCDAVRSVGCDAKVSFLGYRLLERFLWWVQDVVRSLSSFVGCLPGAPCRSLRNRHLTLSRALGGVDVRREKCTGRPGRCPGPARLPTQAALARYLPSSTRKTRKARSPS